MHAELRRAILFLEIRPGQLIEPPNSGDGFGRAAERLCREGLSLKLARGLYVAAPAGPEACQALLEEAEALAERFEPDALVMSEACARRRQALWSGDREAALAADRDFHLALAGSGGQKAATGAWHDRWGRVLRQLGWRPSPEAVPGARETLTAACATGATAVEIAALHGSLLRAELCGAIEARSGAGGLAEVALRPAMRSRRQDQPMTGANTQTAPQPLLQVA